MVHVGHKRTPSQKRYWFAHQLLEVEVPLLLQPLDRGKQLCVLLTQGVHALLHAIVC